MGDVVAYAIIFCCLIILLIGITQRVTPKVKSMQIERQNKIKDKELNEQREKQIDRNIQLSLLHEISKLKIENTTNNYTQNVQNNYTLTSKSSPNENN